MKRESSSSTRERKKAKRADATLAPFLPALNVSLFRTPMPHPIALLSKPGRERAVVKHIRAFFRVAEAHPPILSVIARCACAPTGGVAAPPICNAPDTAISNACAGNASNIGALVGLPLSGLMMDLAMQSLTNTRAACAAASIDNNCINITQTATQSSVLDSDNSLVAYPRAIHIKDLLLPSASHSPDVSPEYLSQHGNTVPKLATVVFVDEPLDLQDLEWTRTVERVYETGVAALDSCTPSCSTTASNVNIEMEKITNVESNHEDIIPRDETLSFTLSSTTATSNITHSPFSSSTTITTIPLNSTNSSYSTSMSSVNSQPTSISLQQALSSTSITWIPFTKYIHSSESYVPSAQYKKQKKIGGKRSSNNARIGVCFDTANGGPRKHFQNKNRSRQGKRRGASFGGMTTTCGYDQELVFFGSEGDCQEDDYEDDEFQVDRDDLNWRQPPCGDGNNQNLRGDGCKSSSSDGNINRCNTSSSNNNVGGSSVKDDGFDWGKVWSCPGSVCEDAADRWENRIEEVKKLYTKKEFLKAGLYSGYLNGVDRSAVGNVSGDAFGTALADAEKDEQVVKEGEDLKCINSSIVSGKENIKKPFKFALPMYHGVTLLDTEEDFVLPFDVFLFVQVVGAGQMAQTRAPQLSSLGKRKPAPFIRLKRNIFVDRKPRKNIFNPPCICVAPVDGGAACREDCLNRMMQFECAEGMCPTGEKCSNQVFQKGESAPGLEICETLGRGFGIRTNNAIPKNKFVMEYCGEIITQETCLERMETMYANTKHYYFLNYDKSEVIDGCRKGSDARFVNHSCDPNCRIEKWTVNGEYHVGLFANRDIPAGSELTYDYKFESFGPMKKCLCGAAKCRGFLGLNKHDARSDLRVLKLANQKTLDPALLEQQDSLDIDAIGAKHVPFAFHRIPAPKNQDSRRLGFLVHVKEGNPFGVGVNVAYFGGVTPVETLEALLKDVVGEVMKGHLRRRFRVVQRRGFAVQVLSRGVVGEKIELSVKDREGAVGLRKVPFLVRSLKGLFRVVDEEKRCEEGENEWVLSAPVFLKRNIGGCGGKRRKGDMKEGVFDVLYDQLCERVLEREKGREKIRAGRLRVIDEVFEELVNKVEDDEGNFAQSKAGSGAENIGKLKNELCKVEGGEMIRKESRRVAARLGGCRPLKEIV